MLVALISGAAGAYATARRDVPAALAGVAIAAALMPPLCAVGIAAALGNWVAAGGALLLFITNIVSIALAGVVVFWWVGVRPAHNSQDGQRPWQQRLVLLLLVVGLMALPLTLALVQITQAEVDKQAVQAALQAAWGTDETRELVDVEIDYNQDMLRIIATVRTADTLAPEEVARVQGLLDARLGRPTTLDVVLMQVVRAPG